MKYQLIPVPENLFKTINSMDSFTTKVQINHFDSDCFTLKMITSSISKMTVKLIVLI